MSAEQGFKVSAAEVYNAASTCQVAIQTRAVRRRLCRYLSCLDQSYFDLAFPQFALNTPIVVLVDEDWMDRKLAIEQLLWRSTDSVTAIALWNGGPLRGEGIRSFLNAFVSMPLANVVSVDISDQCIGLADYFTHFGNHHLPRLRRLSLSLCHEVNVLSTAGVDMEVGCFPSLDDASVRFVEGWCHRCCYAVLRHLRNTRQLALLRYYRVSSLRCDHLSEVPISFQNLRKLRASLRLLFTKEWQERIRFPNLELVVLNWSEVSEYLGNRSKCNSLFPGARIHFSVSQEHQDNALNDRGACDFRTSVDVTLAFADPKDRSSCPSGTRFGGCSELYLSGDLIVPLSLKEVHLQFCLEPIINGRRSGEALERSDIEEIILKGGVDISHLRCIITSVSTPSLASPRAGPPWANVAQDLGAVVRLKFLPLLIVQRNTLVSLDISPELLLGCLGGDQVLRQIVDLRGQLSSVRELVSNGGSFLDFNYFISESISAADLRPFLEMFPSLEYLEIARDSYFESTTIGDFCGACPCLKTLVCYSGSYGDDWMARRSPPWRLETLHWLHADDFAAEHLCALAECVQASYILLCISDSELTLERVHVEAVFARMSCLRWLVLVWESRRLTWICSQSEDSQTVDIVPHNTALGDHLFPSYPHLYSKFWAGLIQGTPYYLYSD
ncbi:hypothetical protein SprV_0301366100 [Sparganum proliferum]